jgi:hypothetical protein
MILLVVAEWVLHYSKKDYYNSLDTISATFIGLVNVGISALLKIGFFGVILFFYNIILEHPNRMVDICPLHCALDFFRYWSID